MDQESKMYEEEHLSKTLEIVELGIKENEMSMDRLYEKARTKSEPKQVIEHLEKVYSNTLEKLKNARNTPYFARIDFQEKGESLNQYYIGKTTVINPENSNIEVIDWRAPISTLYYDVGLGDVSYEAPEGIIKGILTLKRLFEISNGKLNEFMDIDMMSNDELLKPYLSANSDKRLKSIISTIQQEQNKIIREKLNSPIIVQGVAGSGKTTVALHRIAYLAYNYAKAIKPEEFMIIAPNKFFLDYISATLPDLGVEDVKQITFEEFAKEIIGIKVEIENSDSKLAKIVNENNENLSDTQKLATYKASFDFKEALDKYILEISRNYLPKEDLKVCGFIILKYSEIYKMFQECTILEMSLEERTQIFREQLSRAISNIQETIENNIKNKRKSEIDALDTSIEDYTKKRVAIFDKYEKDLELLKNNSKKLIDNYLKKVDKRNPLEYYREFISKLTDYTQDITIDFIEKIQINVLKKKAEVEYEDLAPLMYIVEKINGVNKKVKNALPKYIVIDEAQDYGLFQFYVLKNILKSNSLTILGDLAQGIYSYRGVKEWEEVNEKIFDGKASVLELSKSYRTTTQIMDKANEVLDKIRDKIKVKPAVPVIRSGEEVNIKKQENIEDIVESVIARIKKIENLGLSNIAIIAKTSQEARDFCGKLKVKGIDAKLIEDKSQKYSGGITVISSYLTKGLEFDSVIITDVSREKYSVNELDGKLLYVAITRAMHTLDMFYTGEMSELLG